EDAEHLQDVVDAERLRRSLELIAGLQSTIEDCETALADSVLTEEILETIDGALTDLRVSESHRDASAAQLVIERLSDVAVEVDGERLDGEVGSWVSQAVTRDVELVVPGVLRARLSPARDSGDLDAAVAAAQERLGAALRKGKVTDRAQARIALDRDRETRARRDQARATLRDELGERSVSEISADLARLTARMESYTAAVGDRALPSGVPEARDRVRELQAVEREARAGAGKVTGARDTARERVSAHTLSCTTLETKLAIEEAEVAERRTRLQTAREHLSDHALEAAEAEAIAAEAVARSELQELEVRLAAENADQLESLRTNAVALVGRLTGELTTMTEDARNLKVSLELRGQQGLRETFDLAQSLVEARRGEFERINARALAAQLLFEVLHRHQDTARQRYIAPFRDRVVALGQIVYGGDFDVRVGEDLAIEARTLAGATVEFGHLSAGAQEQLAIITRLACAGLVDEVDGVPVIIDDAMGYSDPARLHKMNAMISTLQSASQVILLTCTPQRYRSIGAAHVIKLEPAGAAAAVS
ncbi:MAG: hypothetical protein JJE50_10395, partial [Actinomycetales bacterium]|nr:hypothetical protein [Actinomycetales bacterium]